MSRTLVGIYENREAAQEVAQALENAGFDRANISFDLQDEGAVSNTSERGGIGGFIDRLFGFDIPEDDAHLYAESVRRGNYAVAVTVNDADVDSAEAILSDYNPIDVDRQEAYYRSTGFTTYNEAHPRLNDDEVMADRAAYSNYDYGYTGNMDDSPNTAADYAPMGSTSSSTTVGSDYGTAGVSDISTSSTTNTTTSTDTTIRGSGSTRTLEGGEQARLEVVEEDLQVGKRAVQRGGVRIRQYVSERPVEASVNLREERVTVQRTAVDRPATAADLNTFEEGVIEITEMREEAVVSKTARVVEEVLVGKEATEHTETVRDTVRRKDVEVEQLVGTERVVTTDTDVEIVDETRRNNP